jgi:hypothetical protein
VANVIVKVFDSNGYTLGLNKLIILWREKEREGEREGG